MAEHSANSRIIAVIPARGGSKGIPQKNLRPMAGVPLVARAVQLLRDVPSISRVVVTTDDPVIATTAVAYGAEVPFLRPQHLATDDAPSMEVLRHCIKNLQASGEEADHYLLFQATSPCCPAAVVERAIEQYLAVGARALRSVTAVKHHPEWMGTLDSDGTFRFLVSTTDRAQRRQDLAPVYRLNGAINIFHSQDVLARLQVPPNAFVMSEEHSVDIDTHRDWDMAERQLSRLAEEGNEWHVVTTEYGT